MISGGRYRPGGGNTRHSAWRNSPPEILAKRSKFGMVPDQREISQGFYRGQQSLARHHRRLTFRRRLRPGARKLD